MFLANPRGVLKLDEDALAEKARVITKDYFEPESNAIRGLFKATYLRIWHPFKPKTRVEVRIVWTFTRFRPALLGNWLMWGPEYSPPRQEEDLLRRFKFIRPEIIQRAQARYAKPVSLAKLADRSELDILALFPELGSKQPLMASPLTVAIWLARPTEPVDGFDYERVYKEVYSVLAHEITHILDKKAGLPRGKKPFGPEEYGRSDREQRARSTQLWFWMQSHRSEIVKLVKRSRPQNRVKKLIAYVIDMFYLDRDFYRKEWESLPEEEKRNKLRIIARFWESIKDEMLPLA